MLILSIFIMGFIPFTFFAICGYVVLTRTRKLREITLPAAAVGAVAALLTIPLAWERGPIPHPLLSGLVFSAISFGLGYAFAVYQDDARPRQQFAADAALAFFAFLSVFFMFSGVNALFNWAQYARLQMGLYAMLFMFISVFGMSFRLLLESMARKRNESDAHMFIKVISQSYKESQKKEKERAENPDEDEGIQVKLKRLD